MCYHLRDVPTMVKLKKKNVFIKSRYQVRLTPDKYIIPIYCRPGYLPILSKLFPNPAHQVF